MDIIEHIQTAILSHGSTVVIAVAGILVLILVVKLGRLIARLLLGLVALAAIGGAIWWFFLRSSGG